MELPRFGSGPRLKPYCDDSTVDVEVKQKAASIALWEQKLTTFEELYNEATPEERKDLLKLHINYLIYTPDGIQLALFRSSSESDRSEVQRDGTSGSPGRTRTCD